MKRLNMMNNKQSINGIFDMEAAPFKQTCTSTRYMYVSGLGFITKKSKKSI